MLPITDFQTSTPDMKGCQPPTLTGLPDEILRIIIERILSSSIGEYMQEKKANMTAVAYLGATCRKFHELVRECASSAIGLQDTIVEHLGPNAIPLSPHNLLPPNHPSFRRFPLAFQPDFRLALTNWQAAMSEHKIKISTNPKAIATSNTAIAARCTNLLEALPLVPLVTPATCDRMMRAFEGSLLTLTLASVEHNQPVAFHAACSAAQFSKDLRLKTLRTLASNPNSPNALGFVNMAHNHEPRTALEELAYLHRRAQERHESDARASLTEKSVLSLAHKLSAEDWKKAFDFYTKPSDKPLVQNFLNALKTCYRDFTTEDERDSIKKGLGRVIRDDLLLQDLTSIKIAQGFLSQQEIQDILRNIQQHYEVSGAGYMWDEVIGPFALAQGLLNQPT